MRLTPGLRRALQTLHEHYPEPVATGRETTAWRIPYLTGMALQKRGLAEVRKVKRIRYEYVVELTDEGWRESTR